jgi:predicted GNAT superfamily acetyltransferase
MEDCHACVELQRQIWEWDKADIVPATLLHVMEHVGGVAAGAFETSGALVGFVFGINGVRDGELVHWSHMLGVRTSMRDSGLGRLLKEYQRAALEAIGVRRISWTFDPLMAKNAHLNINRLGASVESYVPDLYGTTASPLHMGLPTDRLIVTMATTPMTPSRETGGANEPVPVLTPYPRPHDVPVSPGDRIPDMVLIEIPIHILAIAEQSSATARVWRFAVREHFQWALANGYTAASVRREIPGDRAFYVMKRRHPVP